MEEKKRMTQKKLVSIIVVTVAILIIVGGIFYKGYSNAESKYKDIIDGLKAELEEKSDQTAQYTVVTREVNIEVINSEIQDIGELATIEYFYTDAGKYEDPAQLFGKDIPFSFTTKSFIAKWDGVIKAGVDVSKITVGVDDSKKEITVCIPTATILSHEVDANSVETLDEKNGLFNKLKVDDIRLFDSISKEAMEKRVIENGILDKAFENAKEIIEKLINTDVVKELEYKIIFETQGD